MLLQLSVQEGDQIHHRQKRYLLFPFQGTFKVCIGSVETNYLYSKTFIIYFIPIKSTRIYEKSLFNGLELFITKYLKYEQRDLYPHIDISVYEHIIHSNMSIVLFVCTYIINNQSFR